MWPSRSQALAPVLIGGLALALRLFGLDRKSVWFDEAITYFDAHTAWTQLLDSIAHDVHPPLSYVLFHLWPWISAGDFWFRFPSAVLGALAAPLAWIWVRRYGSPALALLTGLTVAIMPLEVDLAQEARMYGLLLLLSAASLWLLDGLLVDASATRMLGYALVAAAMLYTHYYGALLLAAQGVAIVLALREHRRGAQIAVGALALAGLSFVPWLPVLGGQAGAISGDYWIEAPSSTTLWVTFRDLAAHTPPDEPFRVVLRAAYAVQAALIVLGAAVSVRCARQRVAVLLLVVPIGLALAVSVFVAPIYAVRYVSPVGLGFAFLLARGALWLRKLAVPAAASALGPMVLSLWFMYFDPGYGRADLRGAARLVNDQRRADEVVLHLTNATAAPFDYYGVAQPGRVLPSDSRDELCNALQTHAGGWLVTTYPPDDEEARAAAEAEILRADFAAGLVQEPWHRLLGVSVFRLRKGCTV